VERVRGRRVCDRRRMLALKNGGGESKGGRKSKKRTVGGGTEEGAGDIRVSCWRRAACDEQHASCGAERGRVEGCAVMAVGPVADDGAQRKGSLTVGSSRRTQTSLRRFQGSE